MREEMMPEDDGHKWAPTQQCELNSLFLAGGLTFLLCILGNSGHMCRNPYTVSCTAPGLPPHRCGIVCCPSRYVSSTAEQALI